MTYLLSSFILFANEVIFISFRKINKRHITSIILFLIFTFILVFRGDFTTDYNNVILIYARHVSIPFNEIEFIKVNSEFLYILYNKLIHLIFNNAIFSNIILSIFTMTLFYKGFRENRNISFYLLILLPYYSYMFNISRQLFVMSLYAYNYQSLFKQNKNNFIKDIFIFFFGLYFHFGSIIYFPFIFIKYINLNRLFEFLCITIIFILVAFLFFNPDILRNILTTLNPAYASPDSYGMSPNKITNIIIYPLFYSFLLFMIIFKHLRISFTESLMLIGSIVFFVLSLRFQILERFGYYLSIPFLFVLSSKYNYIKLQNSKLIFGILILLLFIFFNYTLIGSDYDPYYTIFE